MAKKNYVTVEHPATDAAETGRAITAKAAQVVQEQVIGAAADIEAINQSRSQAVDYVAAELHRLLSADAFNEDILSRLGQLEGQRPSGYTSMLGGSPLNVDISMIRQEPTVPRISVQDFLALPMATDTSTNQRAIAPEQTYLEGGNENQE